MWEVQRNLLLHMEVTQMSKTIWVVILAMDLIAAIICAVAGNIATTILNCFMAYIAFQFLKMDGGAENED